MNQDRKILTSRDIWQKTVESLRATRRPVLLILIFGLILPQVVLSFSFDIYSVAVVGQVRALFSARAAAPGDFLTLLAPALDYVGRFAVYVVGMSLLIMASYFALVHLAVGHLRGEALDSAGRAWFKGLRAAVPGGLVVGIMLLFLMAIGQVLVAPAILIAVLSLVLPVILIAEKRGPFRSLWQALSLRYVRRTPFSGWAVVFHLLSLGALIYALLLGVGFLSDFTLFFDERLGLARTAWAFTFSGLSFGPAYILTALIQTCLSMAIVALLPALTASLYFLVVDRRELGQA